MYNHICDRVQPKTQFYFTILIFFIFSCPLNADTILKFSENDFNKYRDRVVNMFNHAYEGYLKHAYPYDELKPLSCNGHDTWGSYSLTLIDALDTLVIMGNNSEFRRIAQVLIDSSANLFDIDINASVFETNIRVVGGLLSAHLFQKRAGMELEPGWPCSGPLLRMAENIARKLLPAFDTPTGMPYGTVNLRYGVPRGETTVTCTAGVGTFIIEFASLSRLTGDPIFEKVAMRALRALWDTRSEIGLVGNHIDVSDGKWTALDSGVGGGIDSYFEYLVKGSIMFHIPELLEMYREYEKIIEKHLKRDDWYMWAHMKKGGITLPLFTSLDCYLPGIQCLLGDIEKAMKTIHNFHQVWKQFGFMPEYYNIPKSEVHHNREGYPLRPELIESVVYLYQATKDPYLLEIGVDILESIEHSAKTSCGYATIKDVRDHRLEDRMESFFLAETAKYLYLLFDKDNFIHNSGGRGTVIETPNGECIIDTGGYIFNTEAHPLDLAAVHCCSAEKKEENYIIQQFHDNLNLLELLDISTEKQTSKLGRRLKSKFVRSNQDADEKGKDNSVKNEKTASLKENKLETLDTGSQEQNKHGTLEDSSLSENKQKTFDSGSQNENNDETLGSGSYSEHKHETLDGNPHNRDKTLEDSSHHENRNNILEDSSQRQNEQHTADRPMTPQVTTQHEERKLSEDKTELEKPGKIYPQTPDASFSDRSTSKEGMKVLVKEDRSEKSVINLQQKTEGGFKLSFANQLMDLLSSLTSSNTNTTHHPNMNHLYLTLRNYSLNYYSKPEILHCPAQPFHMRISVLGEMFDDQTDI